MAFSRWPFDERFGWPNDLARLVAALGSPALRMPELVRDAGVFPPVNIYENGDGYFVRAELPGVERDALDISVKGDQLTLAGERKLEVAAGANWHRREITGGQFRRVVTLPKPVDAEHIEATFKNGVLEIRLPLVPEAKPRKIDIH